MKPWKAEVVRRAVEGGLLDDIICRRWKSEEDGAEGLAEALRRVDGLFDRGYNNVGMSVPKIIARRVADLAITEGKPMRQVALYRLKLQRGSKPAAWVRNHYRWPGEPVLAYPFIKSERTST